KGRGLNWAEPTWYRRHRILPFTAALKIHASVPCGHFYAVSTTSTRAFRCSSDSIVSYY
ncbi:hypothetical protein KUCAC02_032553, partial [Chaenocephalus aceratus]